MKRLNLQNNKPFKRWDTDSNRKNYVFWGYRTKEIDINGFYRERWKKYNEVSYLNPFGRLREIANPKKRLNKETGLPFERWDIRKDGKIFWRYRDKPNKTTGYFLEDWREQKNIPYSKPTTPNPIIKNPKRRINPQTGDEFRRWDIDEKTGMIFQNYEDNRPITDDGFAREFWRKPKNLPYAEPQEPQITYLKQCTKCSMWLVRNEEFYKRSNSFDGRESWCKSCKNKQTKKNYSKNKDKHAKLTRQFYENHKLEISQKFRDRYKNDPTFRKQRLVQFYLREERTKRCTPKWVKPSDLTPFYEEARRKTNETGIPHHVDHIIPITHDKICGLNCPSNLRVITAEENLINLKLNNIQIPYYL